MQVSYTKDKNMNEEEARVRAMREAMGDDLMLMVDANDRFNFSQAKELSRRIEQYNIGWFESPISMTTHLEQMPALRQSTTIPMGHSGGLPGQRWFYRKLIESGAVDILQPNVLYVGGYTEAIKIVHLAQANNLRVVTGAGHPAHNMHLIAGIANGWMVECHYGHVLRDQIIYHEAPSPEQGWLTLPESPGLGLQVNEQALKKYEEV
jgi:L-alanine-DL-glutamate epimerase-like enolase superfamily enzyme